MKVKRQPANFQVFSESEIYVASPARPLGWRETSFAKFRLMSQIAFTPMNSTCLVRFIVLMLLVQSLVFDSFPVWGQASNTRKSTEDVNAPEVRSRPGLQPGSGLLFNGWGITPAGTQTQVSDMPLKMIVAPDKKTMLALSGGFRNPGLTLLELSSKKVSQFLPVGDAWNGLTFSKDGRHIFVTGGDYGNIHTFSYRDGKANKEKSVKPSPDASRTFLAGIIAHPSTGKLYVCNEGNHEIWVVDPETLQLESTVAVGMHPHSCIMGADKRHLYVSNWGSRSVSVIDTEKNRRISDISVGLRPNDLVLAPDGRLFVACAGDNTVQVIQTRSVEKPGACHK
jgi:YVTN family beta-propeller protein